MNLEWRLRAALWILRLTGGGRRMHAMTPGEARAALRAQTVGARGRRLHGRLPEMAEIQNLSAPGAEATTPIRLYRPKETSGRALVFYHGGGFVAGGLDEAEMVCRRIASESGRIVCAAGYRLAPEHRFPTAVEDARVAFEWVADQHAALGIDGSRIAIGGESSGGQVAAAVAQAVRDAGRTSIDRQVFIYAGFDAVGTYPSRASAARPPILDARDVEWSLRHYIVAPERREDPRASPIRGELRGLPPALVMVAELDPLRDEGMAYAEALRAAGCEVELRSYARQPHGFLLLGRLSGQSARAFEDIGRFLRM